MRALRGLGTGRRHVASSKLAASAPPRVVSKKKILQSSASRYWAMLAASLLCISLFAWSQLSIWKQQVRDKTIASKVGPVNIQQQIYSHDARFAGNGVPPFVSRQKNPRDETEQNIFLARGQFPHSLYAALAEHSIANFDVLIVGCGLSGTVLADLYARKHGKRVLMLDRRPHIGGNLYDFREKQTDIVVNLYGAHLFHTSKQDVWEYIHRFSTWTFFEHRVVGRVDGKLVPIPVNIDTVNALLGESLMSQADMRTWLNAERKASQVQRNANPDGVAAAVKNSRDVGIGRVGKRLYNKLFKEYTKKQWDVFPEDLGPEVLSRIPVRDDWDDRYFPNDRFQAHPNNGYTAWFEQALDHPNIEVFSSVDYFDVKKTAWFKAHGAFEKTFFTGQIDQFFRDKGSTLKPLQYRSINFETTIVEEPAVEQPAFVVNYPQFQDGMFTRVAEYKHMFHQRSTKSVFVKEFSTDVKLGHEPYYPFPTEENQRHFEEYKKLTAAEEKENNVYFVGRLANYKYFNMDDAIENIFKLYRRLEGSQLLDQAIEEGKAKTPPMGEFTVHIVVSLGATGIPLELAWLGELCAGAASAPDQHWKFFFFNSDRTQDMSLANQTTAALHRAGCGNYVVGKQIFIQNLAPVTGSTRATATRDWLEYFTAGGFEFGDSTLFLQLSDTFSVDIAAAKRGLEIHRTKLHAKGLSRASHAAVTKKDIRAFPHHPAGSLRTVEDFVALHDSNALGAIPIGSLEKHLRPTAGCPQELGHGDHFMATDAAIRRMLSVHRTRLHDELLPQYRMLKKMEGMDWLCLFYRW